MSTSKYSGTFFKIINPGYNNEYLNRGYMRFRCKNLNTDYTRYKITYTCKNKLEKEETHCITSYIDDFDDNIVDAVWEIIGTKHNIKDILNITGLYKIRKCFACSSMIIEESAHMDCPTGCMHDTDNCTKCNN